MTPDHHNSSKQSHSSNIFSVSTVVPSMSNINNGFAEHHGLSEYEKLRARNIVRNNKRMVDLGLMTEEEARISNQKAYGSSTSNELSSNNESLKIQSQEKVDRLKKRDRTTSEGQKGGVSDSKRSRSVSTRSSTRDSSRITLKNTTNLFRPSQSSFSSERNGTSNKENVRKSGRKVARKPYEIEGIWI